ncbi:MAG: NAD-dependent epimerase/dehydratase family protein [Acidobacteria bacterium]|nr:NAD-dependent epimerase/dehydratase family protein [Acidobacteriota bacterium]
MQGFSSEEDLEEFLSRPNPQDVSATLRNPGDFILLGAGGKMGPTLALRLKRAIDVAGSTQRVFAVSRFSDQRSRAILEAVGISILSAELLNSEQLSGLPDAANVIYLAGRKFGSTDNAALTWAMNVLLPARVVERFRSSRIAALSSGNIYPLMPVDSRGADELTPPGPVGEYAQSILGRERMFEYGASSLGTKVINLRLNYALEPRYGILTDIGLKVWHNEPVDLTMPAVNFIWQGDANSYVLQSLALASSPASVLNIAGPDIVSVREIANRFAERFKRPVQFTGVEAKTALLNNGSKAHDLFGPPQIHWHQSLDWTANWIASGRRNLNKPTHFEAWDGKF